MCGAFNINNFKDFSKKILSGDKIIVFGIKGYNFLIKSGRENDIVHYENIDEKGFNYFQLTNISLLIHKLIISHKVNKVNIQYNKFYSSLKQNPESVQIFPINFSKEEYIDVEPSKEEIFNIFFDNYINAILYSCILESKFCEQLARKNAMTEASDNEDKKIKELKLKYNKKRQEKITQEIANISIR
jgi:F-type H+-transporting ATPase subunit gamma